MKVFPTSSTRANPDDSFSDGALVCYENNANVVLGVILGNKKNKYKILNLKGSEVELTPDRLYPLPERMPSFDKTSDKCNFLEKFLTQAEQNQNEIDLATIWESFEGKEVEVSTKQICELFFGNNQGLNHLSTRLALLADKVYFKRKKDTFASRPLEAVSSLLETLKAEEAHQKMLDQLVAELKIRIQSQQEKSSRLSVESQRLLMPLEELAAEATEGSGTKESKNLLEYLSSRLQIAQNGRPEDRALTLLVAIGHITNRTNLAFFRYRPRIEFNNKIQDEVKSIISNPHSTNDRHDLRGLFTFTIDDASTKDMDDALSVEENENGYQIGIHISDVASLISEESELNSEASIRATTIYCPELTINMFPKALSQEKMSLREGVDSLTVSYLINFTRDFEIKGFEIVPSVIKSQRKLSYEFVDEVLKSSPTDSLGTKLHILNECANKLEVDRIDNGAVRVDRKEVAITVNSEGQIICGEYDEGSPARSLVGEMMILANKLSAEFCAEKNIPCLFRAQPEPDVDPFSNPNGVPEGPALDYLIRSRLKRSTVGVRGEPHSSLGLTLYTQVTSPIRRFLDLVIQRQLLHYLSTNSIKYSEDALTKIVEDCDSGLTIARYLSNESRRFWLMQYLLETTPQGGIILGTVVRTDLRNPLISIDNLGLTAMVDLGREVLPGDRVALKIIALKPQRDYFKLEEVS